MPAGSLFCFPDCVPACRSAALKTHMTKSDIVDHFGEIFFPISESYQKFNGNKKTHVIRFSRFLFIHFTFNCVSHTKVSVFSQQNSEIYTVYFLFTHFSMMIILFLSLFRFLFVMFHIFCIKKIIPD